MRHLGQCQSNEQNHTNFGEELETWRNRLLGEIAYFYLDTHYEKMRQAVNVRDAAILMASGVKRDGKRIVLGISVSLSVAEAHWRSFLEGLVRRGIDHQ